MGSNIEAESTIPSYTFRSFGLTHWLLSGYEKMEAALKAARVKKTDLLADLKYKVD